MAHGPKGMCRPVRAVPEPEADLVDRPDVLGYETREQRAKMDSQEYFSRLFDKVSTTDNTPYCCIPRALKFRSEICGGEASVSQYCEGIARLGGARMAEILSTEVLGGSSSSFRRCAFANVRLPLSLSVLGIDAGSGQRVAKWMQELTPAEYETYLADQVLQGRVLVQGQWPDLLDGPGL